MDRKLTRPTPRRQRPRDLPGFEDRHITEIVEAAREYVEQRDERMELTKSEKALKTQLIALMHKHHKSVYKADGIEILLEPTDEKLTVRVKGHERDEDDDSPDVTVTTSDAIRPDVIPEH